MTIDSRSSTLLPVSPAVRSHASTLEDLQERACQHRAVHHPWLLTFAGGGFGDRTQEVAQRFARWYSGYSKWFPHYLVAVIERVTDEDHRAALRQNLAEEKGRLEDDERGTLLEHGVDPADVDGVPHPELFRRFCSAMGVTKAELDSPPIPTVEWRASLLAMLRAGSPAFAVGALGLGTETIVAPTYQLVLRGLDRLPSLSRRDRVFFDLHCHVDDQHQEDLLAIARDLSAKPGGFEEVERGMLLALDLRERFFDALYQASVAGSEPTLTSEAARV